MCGSLLPQALSCSLDTALGIISLTTSRISPVRTITHWEESAGFSYDGSGDLFYRDGHCREQIKVLDRVFFPLSQHFYHDLSSSE
jgi:hypothetical protein